MNDGRVWWTEERIDELRARWSKGETGTQIKRAMGAASRSAVCGKAYRLKLEPRARPDGQRSDGFNGSKTRVRKRKRIKTKTLHYADGHIFMTQGETVIEEPADSFKDPKPFADLSDCHCHWPGAGEVGPELLFCAAPVIAGYPYCLRHCRIAYQKPNRTPRI